MQTFRRLILGVLAVCLSAVVPAAAHAAVYLSPSGNDAASCAQNAPCRSFDRGYRAAAPGDEVVVASGSYGDQTLSNLPAKGQRVVIRPDAGASVKTGYLSLANADDVEIRDIETGGWGVTRGSAHVVLRNISVFDAEDGGYFSGADDVQVIGGEIGRIDPGDGMHFNNAYGVNTNITIDGLFMHDLTRNRDPSAHTDCVQTGDVTGLTIRNSRFVNCATQGVFLNPYNGGATKDITIENNWFGPAQLGYNSLYIGEAVNVMVRNNSFTQNMFIYSGASGIKMVNNILGGMDGYTCQANADNTTLFDYNMSTASCAGATHHVVNPGLMSQFVSSSSSPATALNLHLKAGAAAIDKGSPTNFPGTDFDRNGRPAGLGPDIGAHEYGAGPPIDTGGGGGGGGGGTGGGGGGGGGGSTPTTPSTPTSRLDQILQSLPVGTAAAIAKLPNPKVGTRAPLTVAGLQHAFVCRRATRKCKRTTTRLRVVLARAVKLRVRFLKVRRHHRDRVVRTIRLRAHKGLNVFKVRARRLPRASYRLVLTAPNGAKVELRLRVR